MTLRKNNLKNFLKDPVFGDSAAYPPNRRRENENKNPHDQEALAFMENELLCDQSKEMTKMKKNLTASLFACTITAALSAGILAGCSGQNPLADSSSALPGAAESNGSVGALLLSVNPEIEIAYDAGGNVVSLTGRNEDGKAVLAGCPDYQGQPCKTVVPQLVSRIDDDGYFDTTIEGQAKNIVLKMERGSEYPSEAFLEELAAAVRTEVEADQLGSRAVTLDEDDYDDAYGDKGYINAGAAQEILSAQLGRDDIQFVEKEYDLDDGEYEVEFVLDGVKYEYEVNAVTGKVQEMDADFQDNDDLYDDMDDHDDDLYDDLDDRDDDLYDDDLYDDMDDHDDDLYDDLDDRNDDLYDDDLYDDADDHDDLYDDDQDDWDDDQDDWDDDQDDWDDDQDDWDDDQDDWDDDQDDDDDDDGDDD